MREPQLLVERVGPLVLVQDLGRPGHASLGVPPSGAADRRALRLANRIVGNDEAAPALEVLLGGLALTPHAKVTVAVTGAPAPLTVSGRPAPLFAPVDVPAGHSISLGHPVMGLRSYLAVRGGFEFPRHLGSASSDLTSGLGPPPVRPGTHLRIGPVPQHRPRHSELAAVHTPITGELHLRAVLGPRDEWFTEEAVRTLNTASWQVTSDSDRVGIRLSGPPLSRSKGGELPSEGVIRGAIQVPASGQPLIFFADHPTTGGYPVIAVILDEDTDLLAQAQPDQRVRFSLQPGRWA